MSVRASRIGLLAIVIGLALTGCMRSVPPASSFVAPGETETHYDGFTVYAAFKDLGIRARFERAMCRALIEAGHACVSMLSLTPPTETQDSASRQQAMRRSGAQSALVIELADPTTVSRRLLADGQPGYRISVLDIARQRIVAQIAVENPETATTLDDRALAMARATIDALARESLLATP